MHELFLGALHDKQLLRVRFFSREDGGELVRICAPMDFGPSRRAHDKTPRYHFWDYDSDQGSHTLSLLPRNVRELEPTGDLFDPAEFVTWQTNWIIPRNWGPFS